LPLSFSLRSDDLLLIKNGTIAPEGTIWMKSWYEIAGMIEKNPYVPIKFVTYSGGVMGDEPQLVRKLKLGQLHTIGVSANGLAQIAPETLVLTLPYLFESNEEVDFVIEKMFPTFQKYANEKGYMLMALYDVGWVRVASREPLNHPQDLFQRKIWSWSGDPISQRIFQGLGITPISLPAPEVMTALQTGLIDTLPSTTLTLVGFQWHTQTRYLSPPFIYAPASQVISLKLLQKIPPDKREKLIAYIMEVTKPFIQKFQATLRAQEEETIQELKKGGMTVVSWNREDQQWLRKRSEKVYQEMVGNLYPKEVYEELMRYLTEYREKKGIQ
jgi:TRAP-type C4-dicarboxylate transport system substrate-binding protein